VVPKVTIGESLAAAPGGLRPALEWFHDRRGHEIDWPSPSPVPGVEFLVAQAKGIYKPRDYDVALSVRIMETSPYADLLPVSTPNGGWVCAYHQEGISVADRDEYFTNVGLLANAATRAPVALLRQIATKPRVRYEVVGLALVAGWSDGFFFLVGFDNTGAADSSIAAAEDAVLRDLSAQIVAADSLPESTVTPPADPEHDARVRVLANVVRRQGQGKFRDNLIDAYGGRCVVSGCTALAAIDAAHIRPYMGSHTNDTANGLLLRTDIHALFDCGLVAVDPVTGTVIVASSVIDPTYRELHGVKIHAPKHEHAKPDSAALLAHLEWCGERLSTPS